MDLSSPWIRYYFLTLICLVSGIIAALLSFHVVLLYVLPLLLAIQYRDGKALWFAFGVNTVTMTASMLTGFYFGLCDLNLLYASNHSLSWYMQRIGGDEFLLVIDEPASGEAAELIKKVREELSRSSEEGGIRISSAAGYAEGAGADIKEVVKCADAKMYEDKNAGREGRE